MGNPSEVPLSPESFAEKLTTKTFTNGTDSSTVVELYERVFQGFAEREVLRVVSWRDEHIEVLLKTLPHLPGMKRVKIDNICRGARASNRAIAQLEGALAERGGELEYYNCCVSTTACCICTATPSTPSETPHAR